MYALGYYGGLFGIVAVLYHYFPNTVTGVFQLLVGLAMVCVQTAISFFTMLAGMLS
jgi:hypothetical protein